MDGQIFVHLPPHMWTNLSCVDGGLQKMYLLVLESCVIWCSHVFGRARRSFNILGAVTSYLIAILSDYIVQSYVLVMLFYVPRCYHFAKRFFQSQIKL